MYILTSCTITQPASIHVYSCAQ